MNIPDYFPAVVEPIAIALDPDKALAVVAVVVVLSATLAAYALMHARERTAP